MILTFWIIRRHLGKASGSISSQTNLLKENPSRAFKHKDATQGSGKLWATCCCKLRGYMRYMVLCSSWGFCCWQMPGDAELMLHSIWLLWCHALERKAEKVRHRHRRENWAAVLQKKIWGTSGSKAEPESSVLPALGKAHSILEYVSSENPTVLKMWGVGAPTLTLAAHFEKV